MINDNDDDHDDDAEALEDYDAAILCRVQTEF